MSAPAFSPEELPAAAPAALPSTPPSSADIGTALPPSQLSLQPTAPGSQLDSSAADVTMAAADAPAAPLAASAEPQPPSSSSTVSSPACGPQLAAAGKPATPLDHGSFETDQVAAAAREAEQKTAELAEDPSVVATATADSSAAVTTVAAAAAKHAGPPSAVDSSASEAMSENVAIYEKAAGKSAAAGAALDALAASAGANSAPQTRSSLQSLLQYARAVSDHTIRKGPFFEPNFPGSLVSQWQPQEWKYRVPLSLVWAYDEQANKMRNDSQDVADWQKVMPLLPMYTFSVAGDGDCLMHSAMLADCTLQQREFSSLDAPAGVPKMSQAGVLIHPKVSTLKAIAQTVVSAARDPLTGAVLPASRSAVTAALLSYRARLLGVMHHAGLHASKNLQQQLEKPSAPLANDECAPFLSLLHEAPACIAEWDRRWLGWMSDRTYPAGIVMLDRANIKGQHFTPIPYGRPIPDQDIDIPDAEPQKNDRTKQPFFVLQSAASSEALLPAGKHASPSLAHVQPLIPAPQWMLRGPQHPCYPMLPTVWLPFEPSLLNENFLTPYHSGWFNTDHADIQPGDPSKERKPQYSAEQGSVQGTVHFGSVVAFRTKQLVGEQQGVVVLTGVRMSRAVADAYQQEVQAYNQLHDLMKEKVPLPYVLVLRLKALPSQIAAAASAGHGSRDNMECWQGGAASDEPLMVPTSGIYHVFRQAELGAFGKATKHAPLQHIDYMDAVISKRRVSKVPNPADPSPLRKLIEADACTRAVVDSMLKIGGIAEDARSSEFAQCLAQLQDAAHLQYPVDQLLCARARMNCAQPLHLPGTVAQSFIDAGQADDQGEPITEIDKDTLQEMEAAEEAEDLKNLVMRERDKLVHQPLPGETSDHSSFGRPKRVAQLKAEQHIAEIVKLSKLSDKQALAAVPAAPKSRTPRRGASVTAEDETDNDSQMPNDVMTAPSASPRGSRKPRAAAAAAAAAAPSPLCSTPVEDDDDEAVQVQVDERAEQLGGDNATTAEAKNIFFQLSDPLASEHMAPLAGWVLNQVLSYGAKRYSDEGFIEWQEELWRQLSNYDGKGSIDAELYAFLLAEAVSSTNVSDVVDKLAKPDWRMGKGIKQAKKAQRDAAMWFYRKGARPPAKTASLYVQHKEEMAAPRQPRKQRGKAASTKSVQFEESAGPAPPSSPKPSAAAAPTSTSSKTSTGGKPASASAVKPAARSAPTASPPASESRQAAAAGHASVSLKQRGSGRKRYSKEMTAPESFEYNEPADEQDDSGDVVIVSPPAAAAAAASASKGSKSKRAKQSAMVHVGEAAEASPDPTAASRAPMRASALGPSATPLAPAAAVPPPAAAAASPMLTEEDELQAQIELAQKQIAAKKKMAEQRLLLQQLQAELNESTAPPVPSAPAAAAAAAVPQQRSDVNMLDTAAAAAVQPAAAVPSSQWPPQPLQQQPHQPPQQQQYQQPPQQQLPPQQPPQMEWTSAPGYDASAPAPPTLSEERIAAQLAAQNTQLMHLLQMQMQQYSQTLTPPRRKPRAPQHQLLPGSGGYGMPSYPMYPQISAPAASYPQLMPPPTYGSAQVTVTDEDQEDADDQTLGYHAGAAAAAAAAAAAGASGSGGQAIRRGRTAPSAIPAGFQSAAVTAPQPQQALPFSPNAHLFQQIGQAAYQAAAASIRQLPQPHK